MPRDQDGRSGRGALGRGPVEPERSSRPTRCQRACGASRERARLGPASAARIAGAPQAGDLPRRLLGQR
eukprot:516400-Alexandrium_andersonii.AAC.1